MSKAERQSPTIFRQFVHCLGRMLFYVAIAAGFTALFQGTAAAQDATITEIKPVTQPDTILRIVFSKPVKPTSVKIGNVDAAVVSQVPCDNCDVRVPANVTPGRQTITVVAEGATNPITTTVKVAPLILGLKAHKNAEAQFSRVVIAGGEVLLQFSEKMPAEIRQGLNVRLFKVRNQEEQRAEEEQRVKEQNLSEAEQRAKQQQRDNERVLSVEVIPDDTYLTLKTPNNLATSTYAVQVFADGVLLQRETRLRGEDVRWLYLRATVIVLGILLLIYFLYKVRDWISRFRGRSSPQLEGRARPRYSFLKMLLLEPENQTYSLSRAQFFSWLFVIAWAYLFLYYVHGFIEANWSFPNFGNAIYAFLISLGTLVAAQATSRGMGVKGAGEEHPSVADLVVHGGVLALDRVQQVVWTLIALGMFIRITVSTYETASSLPEIPTELLTLMGLSSAGYLGGKLVRGPGPVVDQVTVPNAGGTLNIKGQHLSKDAFVWLDGVQQKGKVTSKVDDPDQPLKFAQEIEVTLDMTLANWHATEHAITVVNPDAQRADWRTLPQITEVQASAPVQNKVTLTIKTAHVVKGATLNIADAPDATIRQDATNPNLFTAADVDPTWPTQPHVLTITSNGRVNKFNFKPNV